VANPRQLWEEHKGEGAGPGLTEDFRHRNDPNPEHSALRDIERLLRSMGGKSLQDYNLPIPPPATNENGMSPLIREEVQRHGPREAILAEHDRMVGMLNTQQREAYNTILAAVHAQPVPAQMRSFFIDGPGGTGKTFLYNTILAYVRSREPGTHGHVIALATASSGIAALLLQGGRTAHSQFKIPVPIKSNSTCNIPAQSDLARLIRAASLILWDEAPMMHKEAIQAVDRALRDIMGVLDVPFGGKVVVMGGDFRQVLPVIVRGSRADIVGASLKRSTQIWPETFKLQLHLNMRAMVLQAQNVPYQHLIDFSEWLMRVGEGDRNLIVAAAGEDCIRIPEDMACPTENVDDLITEMYGDLNNLAPNARAAFFRDNCIVTPKNDVDIEINNKVMDMFVSTDRSPVREYLSEDSVIDDNHGAMYPVEFLNSLNPSGVPPHVLRLKVGCPIMLMRNMPGGLANGTRLIVTELKNNVIVAEVITGPTRGNIVYIPRLSITPSDLI